MAFDVAEAYVAAEAEEYEAAGASAALRPQAEVGVSEEAEIAGADATMRLPAGRGRHVPRWWFLPVAATVAAAVAQLLVFALPRRPRLAGALGPLKSRP